MKQETNKKSKTSSILLVTFVIGSIVFLCLCAIVSEILASQPQNNSETEENNAGMQRPTATPAIVISYDKRERDGVKFEITHIRLLQSEVDLEHQILALQLLLQSGDVGWTGFDVKNSEMILDDELGNRYSALSTNPVCIINDDEICKTEVLFEIMANSIRAKLFYVSNRGLSGQDPIEVDEPSDRRFIAELNLQNIVPELAPTATSSATPTVTPIPTNTPTETLTPTSTVIPTPGYLPILGRVWSGVKVYYGANKAYGFEILGGSEDCPSLPSGRGVLVQYPSGSKEWKDREYLISSGLFFVFSDDPALSDMLWYVYSSCP